MGRLDVADRVPRRGRQPVDEPAVEAHHQPPERQVAGLVLVRQRPGSAESIFMTIEDETAIANIIVWPHVFEKFRGVVMGARLVAVTGKVQNESNVVHVLAERLDDLTSMLDRLSADEIIPAARSGPQFFGMSDNVQIMPKGRNFH